MSRKEEMKKTANRAGGEEKDDGKTADMYHFRSRFDRMLFIGFILLMLLILLVIMIFGQDADAAGFVISENMQISE